MSRVASEMFTNIRIWALLSQPRPWRGVSYIEPMPQSPGWLPHELDLLGIFRGPHFLLRTNSVKGSITTSIISLPTCHTTATFFSPEAQTQLFPGHPQAVDMGAPVLASYCCCNKLS